MKNPNGYGSVHKLSGKRRKPFAVRITISKPSDNKQKYKYLGYYETRQDAMISLAEYNKNPYNIEVSTITFKEIFEKYSEEKFNKISKSNINGYKSAFNMAKPLHDLKFVDVRKPQLQSIIDKCDKGYGTKKKIKVLFNQMFKYALENDIVVKDYSKFVELVNDNADSTRQPFTKNEIQKLWDNVDRMDFIDTILIMIYSGIRPGELITIETKNVDLENRVMRGGIKTKSSKNRIIPINKKVLPLVEKRLSNNNQFLIVNHENKAMGYWNYYEEKWKKMMEQLEMNHKPHDCRHTFATLMDNAGANKLSIKRIMGLPHLI